MTREKLKNVAAQQDQLKLVATRLKSCCGFLQESLRTGSQVEILAMGKSFVKQAQDVTSSFKPESLKPKEQANLEFLRGQNELSQICEQYGEVYNSYLCHTKCSVKGDRLKLERVGELAIATVEVVDQKGKEWRCPVEVSCELVSSDGSRQFKEKAKKVRDGEYKIGYIPKQRGSHSLHVRVKDKHISGSPFPLSVITTIPTNIITGLEHPWGQALDNEGQLIVSEFTGQCVSLLSSNKQRKSIGNQGSRPGQLNHPCGVAFSVTGDILVADQFNHRIQVFSRDGNSLKCVGTRGKAPLQFNCPIGIAVHPTSKKIYVADSDNNRVHVLNKDLTFCTTFGSTGSGKGDFNNPLGVSFDGPGNLYVSDSNNHRVQVFTENGKYIRQFGGKGSGEGELSAPRGVAVDSNDIVYVGDFDNHRIAIFTPEGHFLGSFGSKGNEPGQFYGPSGITISIHGDIYVSDRMNNRIQVF